MAQNGDPLLGRIRAVMLVAMWLSILGLLTLFFDSWLERQYNPNQSVETHASASNGQEVVLQRNHAGHYIATGSINGREVIFMVDTGASDVSIPAPVAQELKLKRGRPVLYSTAKGPAVGYKTRLKSVGLGDIVLEDVRASINPNVKNDNVLLGMSFLRHLEFTQRDDVLVIRQAP